MPFIDVRNISVILKKTKLIYAKGGKRIVLYFSDYQRYGKIGS